MVVIGASAGGVGALIDLVAGLPAGLPAAVLVVLHVPPYSPSALPEILTRSGPLDAVHPEDGDPIRPGRIYIAAPDHHLLVEEGRVAVKRGPKENRHRPAVDALFRSAAFVCGPRVVGVVLTGALDDGTSGLWTVKRRGGVAVVQDPVEAAYGDMPMSALEQVEVDHTLPAAEMGPLIGRLVGRPAPAEPEVSEEEQRLLEMEVKIATRDNAFERGIIGMGELTPFTCPECHGALVRLGVGRAGRFRCHTGHAFTPGALLAGITETAEDPLWQAMRGLEEAPMLLNDVGRHLEASGDDEAASVFFRKGEETARRARAAHGSAQSQERLSGDLRHEPGYEVRT